MPLNVQPMQPAFVGGELSPKMQGRTDVAVRAVGCETIQNCIVTVQGPVEKRSGTRFVAPCKFNTGDVRLERFEFSQDEAYTLEIGDEYIRFFRDEGAVLDTAISISGSPVQANPVQLNLAGHGRATGDHLYITGSGMEELNDQFWRMTVIDPNTVALDDANGTTWTTGTGGEASPIYELATDYTEDQVGNIQVDQSNDILFMFHPDVFPQRLSRFGDINWTIDELPQSEPAWAPENADEAVTLLPGAETGTSVSMTASGGTPFSADMVGQYIRLRELYANEHPKWNAAAPQADIGLTGVGDRAFNDGRVYSLSSGTSNLGYSPPLHDSGTLTDGRLDWTYINDGYGYAKITGYTSPTVVTVDVDTDGVRFPLSVLAGSGTFRWAVSAWGPQNGYPAAGGFYEDRLLAGGSAGFPQTVWGSYVGDYYNFKSEGENAEGLFFSLNTRRRNVIEWMIGEKSLWIGTGGAEFTLDSGNVEQALTRENFLRKKQSSYGSRRGLTPLGVDSYTLFVQRAGRRVHEIAFSFDLDRYQAKDLTEMSDEILSGIAKGIVATREPFRLVWCWQEDGSLAAITYARDQEVAAWHRHVIAGTDSKVISMTSVPHPDGDEDQTWLAVEREVNGQTVRSMEFFEKRRQRGDDQVEAFYLDSALSARNATRTSSSLAQVGGLVIGAAGHGYSGGERVTILSATDATNSAAMSSKVWAVQVVTADFWRPIDPDTGESLIELGVSTTNNGSISWSDMKTVWTGLRHLEGETVAVLADGAPVENVAVSNGTITLPEAAYAIVVGLPYVAKIKTMRLMTPGRVGSNQGKQGRWNGLVIRCDQTGPGLWYGPDFDTAERVNLREVHEWSRGQAELNVPRPLLDGDTGNLAWPGGWEQDQAIAVEHRSPLPFSLVALMASGQVEERT